MHAPSNEGRAGRRTDAAVDARGCALAAAEARMNHALIKAAGLCVAIRRTDGERAEKTSAANAARDKAV